MLILTTESVPGKKIKEVVGLVKGSTIRAKHIGKDIGAGFKQLVGGDLTGYDEILGLGIPAIVVISSVILFIVKIIERIKEKKNEDFDKYNKY